MTIDLSTAKLKERIIKYLQTRYRKTGVNTPISWRAIWIELGATEENFSKALQAAADAVEARTLCLSIVSALS